MNPITIIPTVIGIALGIFVIGIILDKIRVMLFKLLHIRNISEMINHVVEKNENQSNGISKLFIRKNEIK